MELTIELDRESDGRWIAEVPELNVRERLGRLSERERSALLKTFDEVVPLIAARSTGEVDRELAEVRQARRSGGRHRKTKLAIP